MKSFKKEQPRKNTACELKNQISSFEFEVELL